MKSILFSLFIALALSSRAAAQKPDIPATSGTTTPLNTATTGNIEAPAVLSSTSTAPAVPQLSDREITREIRRAIVTDKSLSTFAHNVRIRTRKGQVVLKGSVPTLGEKNSVGVKAADIVGEDKVINNIKVR